MIARADAFCRRNAEILCPPLTMIVVLQVHALGIYLGVILLSP